MGLGKTWPQKTRDGLTSPPWTEVQTLQDNEDLSGTEPVKRLIFQKPNFQQKSTRCTKKQKHGLFKGRT